ncbi:hypothetical protein FRB96_004747 [Tulasnella sp. 330]|nr:hypothetical protein FRB96_004747 [Tulasnella sp. 330]
MNKSQFYLQQCSDAASKSPMCFTLGAVLVKGGKIISTGYNHHRTHYDGSDSSRGQRKPVSMHAEMHAIYSATGFKSTHGAFHPIHHVPEQKQVGWTKKNANRSSRILNQRNNQHLVGNVPRSIEINPNSSAVDSALLRRSNSRVIQPKGQKGRESQPRPNQCQHGGGGGKKKGQTRGRRNSSSASSSDSGAVPPQPKVSKMRSPEDIKLWDARRRDPRVNGADLYVARFTKSGLGPAKPCGRCVEWCRWAGVKRVFHWNPENGAWDVLKVNDPNDTYLTHADKKITTKTVRSDDNTSLAATAINLPDTNNKWAIAHAKAKTFLQKFSLKDKVNIVTGVGWMNGRCVGNIPANETLGWPGLCLEDSPLGVRYTDFVTAFPPGINAAATFDRKLMRLRGEAMGKEFRGKGVNVALGPVMNMARTPEGGRLWESFGGDPYLQGEAAYETIVGIQKQGVQACAKHFINKWEAAHAIFLKTNTLVTLLSLPSHTVLLTTIHHTVNNTYACQNDEALNTLLKHQLGFQGYVMSDWAATESTNAANEGLDMTMPGDITFGSGNSYFGANLTDAVNGGSVRMSRLDDMAQRIIAAWYLTGQDQGYPAVNFNAFNRTDEATNEHINVEDDHYKIAREIGAASIVVLKNIRNTLPLRSVRSLSVVGSDARPPPSGPNGYTDRGGTDGTLAMGWGSGNNLTAWENGDALVQTVAQNNSNVVVVIHSVGALILEPWIDHPNVTAVVWAGLPGQESGNSLVDVLYGDVNPSGRLPYTIAKSASDYPAHVVYNGSSAVGGVQIDYAEGLDIDYRWFDAKNITPRFEFGYGLSYTTFQYSNLVIKPVKPESSYDADEKAWDDNQATSNHTGASLDSWLHEAAYSITFCVKNIGSMPGWEVPQLYLHAPSAVNSPPNILRGFERVEIQSGQTATVTMQLSRYDLSIWDIVRQGWAKPLGTWHLSIGASSRDLRLSGTIE